MATQGLPCDPLAMRIIMPAPNIVLFLNYFSSKLQYLGFRHNIFFLCLLCKNILLVFFMILLMIWKLFNLNWNPAGLKHIHPHWELFSKRLKKPSSPAYQLLSKLLLVSKDFSLKNRWLLSQTNVHTTTTNATCHFHIRLMFLTSKSFSLLLVFRWKIHSGHISLQRC